jgi:hypothetical protein
MSSTDVRTVTIFQKKIDKIVEGIPVLFTRLRVILTYNAIWDLVTHQDPYLVLIASALAREYHKIRPRVRKQNITRGTNTVISFIGVVFLGLRVLLSKRLLSYNYNMLVFQIRFAKRMASLKL